MFSKVLGSFLLIVATSCAPSSHENDVHHDQGTTARPTATPQPATPRPASPARPTATPVSQEITLDSITAANPLLVRGRARTFENSVSLRVRDARGALLAEQHGTSVGEMGQHNPFEARLWIVHDPGATVTVEAFEYSAKDGSIRSLVRKTVAYEVEPIAVTLQFPAGDCTKLAAFKRTLPKSVAMARLLTEALVAGPDSREKSAGATSPFPRDATVRSVLLRDGALTVDFNERLQNVGGSCAALGIRESVVRTLEQLPNVTRVNITAGGSSELALQP